MTAMERFANSIVVPVVVLEKVEDAVPTARAMAAGGVDTMEITFRSACAPEAIKAVTENCPDVLVGAGTIVNLDQCKLALEMGAKFIVSPGFSEEIVSYCVEHNVPVFSLRPRPPGTYIATSSPWRNGAFLPECGSQGTSGRRYLTILLPQCGAGKKCHTSAGSAPF